METLERFTVVSTSTYSDFSTPRFVTLDEPTQRIAEAVAGAAGNAASNVSNRTKMAAKALVLFAHRFGLGAPEITVESSGEISLEWYKDRQHLVVLSVDGQNLRWLTMNGPGKALSGVQAFDQELPEQVLKALGAVT